MVNHYMTVGGKSQVRVNRRVNRRTAIFVSIIVDGGDDFAVGRRWQADAAGAEFGTDLRLALRGHDATSEEGAPNRFGVARWRSAHLVDSVTPACRRRPARSSPAPAA